MPAPRDLPQQIPAPRAKIRMQKPRSGGKFSMQIPGGARGGMVMAKIDNCINFTFLHWFQKLSLKKVRLRLGVLQYLIWFQKPCITNPVFENFLWWLTSYALWNLPLK